MVSWMFLPAAGAAPYSSRSCCQCNSFWSCMREQSLCGFSWGFVWFWASLDWKEWVQICTGWQWCCQLHHWCFFHDVVHYAWVVLRIRCKITCYCAKKERTGQIHSTFGLNLTYRGAKISHWKFFTACINVSGVKGYVCCLVSLFNLY